MLCFAHRTPCMASASREILRRPCLRSSLKLTVTVDRIGTAAPIRTHTYNGRIISPSALIRFYSDQKDANNLSFAEKLKSGPSLEHFIANSQVQELNSTTPFPSHEVEPNDDIPYVSKTAYQGNGRAVYFDTYGCQMNVSDMDVVWTILQQNGYHKASDLSKSDVVLVMTCAIREGAEQKIWKRLHYLKHLKRLRQRKSEKPPMKIGILGCMAERLKQQIVEKEKMVDVVCGPDAYRDLPRLLAVTDSGVSAVNVQLSLEETYADIIPVRINSNSKSAFVSIQRGCDNMCSYCIVPFTRGRERSRAISSIVEEVRVLSDLGIKEVTLLGQNVNSYRDLSEQTTSVGQAATGISRGFNTVYKPKKGGRLFADLLDQVSSVDPEMRIRFTSPHPKDFPDEVLHLILERNNVCNQLHMPAQSGSSRVLDSMRRGYTREAYIDLVTHVREIIPDVALSSDFIAGFCGETEEDHLLSVDLIKRIKYNFAYCYPYSLRNKTRAWHKLEDDVSPEVKSRRHMELIGAFRDGALQLNQTQVGKLQLVLVENTSKKSDLEYYGRNDGNTKVIFAKQDLPIDPYQTEKSSVQPGCYIIAKITGASSQVLRGEPICHSTLTDFLRHKSVLEEYSNSLSSAVGS